MIFSVSIHWPFDVNEWYFQYQYTDHLMLTSDISVSIHWPFDLNEWYFQYQYTDHLMLTSDIFSINTLTILLKIICHCDIKHIMMLLIKTKTSVLKVLTFIIRLAVILASMSFSTIHNSHYYIYIHKNLLALKMKGQTKYILKYQSISIDQV